MQKHTKAIITVVAPLAIAGFVGGQVAAAAPPAVAAIIAGLLGGVAGIGGIQLMALFRPDVFEKYSLETPDQSEFDT